MRWAIGLFAAGTLMACAVRPTLAADPPAAAIATKMAGVTDELNRNLTGTPVQTEQKAIVHDLDDLIAKLEKKREGMGNGRKNARPNRGMRDSMIGAGPGGVGDLENRNDVGKDWNKLTPRERDRILQSMSEGFPPEYRTVLERYYRRLADEKSSTNGAAKDKEPQKEAKADEAP